MYKEFGIDDKVLSLASEVDNLISSFDICFSSPLIINFIIIFDKSDTDNELKQFSIHIRSKTETCLIECVNNRIRHYLARFRRKSLCLSKSIEMLEYSLYLLFNKLYWKIV